MFMLSNSILTFAGPKGDPLDEHEGYIGMLRDHFERREKDRQTSDSDVPPCCWEKYPSYIMFCDDYRTVRVYNIPLLLRNDRSDSFLKAFAQLLIEARKEAVKSEKIAKSTGQIAAKLFLKNLNENLKGNENIKTISEFLGTDEKIAIESFICSLGMAAVSHALGVGIAVSCAFDILSKLFNFVSITPGVGMAICVVHNLVNVARIWSTRSQFYYEKVANYATVLNDVYRIIITRPEDVLKSNVLVTAVDERNFWSVFLWNSAIGRRNDGAWCDFEYIGGLKCAPRAKDCKDRDLIMVYSKAYGDIMTKSDLDLKKLQDFLDGKLAYVEFPITQKEERKKTSVKIEEV